MRVDREIIHCCFKLLCIELTLVLLVAACGNQKSLKILPSINRLSKLV